MVSKLNVRPFHNVNSPLEAPVISRLPSGVHYKQTLRIITEQSDTHKHTLPADNNQAPPANPYSSASSFDTM